MKDLEGGSGLLLTPLGDVKKTWHVFKVLSVQNNVYSWHG